MLSAITEHEREEEIPVQSSHMDVEAGTGAHEEAQRAERLNFWQQEVQPPPPPPFLEPHLITFIFAFGHQCPLRGL